jgi:hypothetical protein
VPRKEMTRKGKKHMLLEIVDFFAKRKLLNLTHLRLWFSIKSEVLC